MQPRRDLVTVTSDWSMLGRYSTNILRKVNFILFHMVHLFIYSLLTKRSCLFATFRCWNEHWITQQWKSKTRKQSPLIRRSTAGLFQAGSGNKFNFNPAIFSYICWHSHLSRFLFRSSFYTKEIFAKNHIKQKSRICALDYDLINRPHLILNGGIREKENEGIIIFLKLFSLFRPFFFL